MAFGATLASLLMAAAMLFLLVLSGIVAAYASYAIYAIGNLAQGIQLLTAHTVVTTAAMMSLFVAVTLLVIFVSVAGARGFTFTDAEESEGREAIAWTPKAAADFAADLRGGAQARGTYKFFAAVVGICAAFALVAFGLCLEGWFALAASQASGASLNTAKWATIAATLLFFLTFGLFLGGVFLYAKYAKKAGLGVESLMALYAKQAAAKVQ